MVLTLHVQPGAKKTEIAGLHGDALKIRLAAPPVEGKANDCLIVFLAQKLGIAKRQPLRPQMVREFASNPRTLETKSCAARTRRTAFTDSEQLRKWLSCCTYFQIEQSPPAWVLAYFAETAVLVARSDSTSFMAKTPLIADGKPE